MPTVKPCEFPRQGSPTNSLVELVELLKSVDLSAPNARLNTCSMLNHALGKSKGVDEMRTWFYHYKTLMKNDIIKPTWEKEKAEPRTKATVDNGKTKKKIKARNTKK